MDRPSRERHGPCGQSRIIRPENGTQTGHALSYDRGKMNFWRLSGFLTENQSIWMYEFVFIRRFLVYDVFSYTT